MRTGEPQDTEGRQGPRSPLSPMLVLTGGRSPLALVLPSGNDRKSVEKGTEVPARVWRAGKSAHRWCGPWSAGKRWRKSLREGSGAVSKASSEASRALGKASPSSISVGNQQ